MGTSNLYHQEHQQPPSMHQNNTGKGEPPVYHGVKDEPGQQGQTPPLLAFPSSPSQPGSNVNPHAHQPPYGQQATLYAPFTPYYSDTSEAYYAAGPGGYFPISFVAHSEMADANNLNSITGHMYPQNTENYPHPMSTVYPPYMYPAQHAFYPIIPPPNGQESWYPVLNQPQ